jgi:hypothetical protein
VNIADPSENVTVFIRGLGGKSFIYKSEVHNLVIPSLYTMQEMLEMSCVEFWRYSNITCCGYPLGPEMSFVSIV